MVKWDKDRGLGQQQGKEHTRNSRTGTKGQEQEKRDTDRN